jgi:hypothetical protein
MEKLTSVRITRWEPTALGYLLAFVATDTEEFYAAKEIVKNLSPWSRRYHADIRAWWVSEESASLLIRNFEPLRRYLGSTGQHQQHQETRDGGATRNQATRPPQVPAEVAQAFAALHLAPTAPPELLAAARRVLARLHHPDAGGDHQAMIAVNNAADTCEAWLDKQSSSTTQRRRETA